MKKIRKPKPWKHPQPITKTDLVRMRDEFWDTAPHYGGRKGNNVMSTFLVCTMFLVRVIYYELIIELHIIFYVQGN